MTNYPFFNPDNKTVFPIKQVEGENMLLHCMIHQNCSDPTSPEHQATRAAIETLRHAFKIKAVSTTYCPTCLAVVNAEIDKL